MDEHHIKLGVNEKLGDSRVKDDLSFPLGLSIKNKVKVLGISRDMANYIHQKYHSYVNQRRHNTVLNHGVYFEDKLVGAVSYSYPLINSLNGTSGKNIIEVARVTIVADIPNLASCSMSRSQDKFENFYAESNNIQKLVTWVREGYDGSMFKALEGKGWRDQGWKEGHQAGNRKDRDIRSYDKKRFVCDLHLDNTQSKLDIF